MINSNVRRICNTWEMDLPHPFTRVNVITATMDVLNSYPEDAYAKQAKHSLGRLRTRLGYAAPECSDNAFWHSSVNYEGYYDICRVFNESGPRSDAMMSLYSAVQTKFKSKGFEKCVYTSER